MKIVVEQGNKTGQMIANRGMAMLEVLIAMLVVAIGILPLVFLQVQADRGVMSAYTKVEHNAVALSIMDMVAADANKNAWVFNLASGSCDGSCEWRKNLTDDLLTEILPDAGSGLVCISKDNITSSGSTASTSAASDRSFRMTVTLWWFSSGRGKVDIGTNSGGKALQDKISKTGSFTDNDCNDLSKFAGKLNIDTIKVTRIF